LDENCIHFPNVANLVAGSGLKQFEGFLWILAIQFDGCAGGDVACGIKALATEHTAKLVADVPLQCLIRL